MGQLGRRVDALEAIAEEARLRPYRAFAAELGMPVGEVLAELEAAAAVVNPLVAEGLAADEIMERCARHWNISLDALRRNCQDRARRRGVDLTLVQAPPRSRPAPRGGA